MSWLNKLKLGGIRTQGGNKRGVPEGLWEKCDNCGAALYAPEVDQHLHVFVHNWFFHRRYNDFGRVRTQAEEQQRSGQQ